MIDIVLSKEDNRESLMSDVKNEYEMARIFEEKLYSFKKVRLIEDKLSYEDLAIQNNFSDEEVTFSLNRQMLKDRKDKLAL